MSYRANLLLLFILFWMTNIMMIGYLFFRLDVMKQELKQLCRLAEFSSISELPEYCLN